MRRSRLVILAACSLSLGGCGTFSDTMCGPLDDHVFYRGVRFDVMAAKEGCEALAHAMSDPKKDSASGRGGDTKEPALRESGVLTLMAADIPLSAIADTLLLPYLAYQKLAEPPPRYREEPARQQERAAGQAPPPPPTRE